jgi:hypothetical protein
MSAAVIEGSGSQSAQLEAALAAATMEGEPGHDSDDDFQYEEVEVPR